MSNSRYRARIAIAIVTAVGALVLGVRATNTGGEDNVTISSRPDMVEHVYPPNGDQVLRQSEIGVDLGPGYEGDLVVNGQPIPEEELRRVPEPKPVIYLPRKGPPFAEARKTRLEGKRVAVRV